jgi:hypothetical protein
LNRAGLSLSTIFRRGRDYDSFISGPHRPISNLYGDMNLCSGGVKQLVLSAMTAFAPQRVFLPHHFDIRVDARGRWIARDRDGMCGGTFRTRADALRFALFETGGDASYIHTRGIRP